MKKLIISGAFITGVLLITGCSKPNDVPPPNKGLLKDYVLPPASFLTPAERAILEERREEYIKIL